jgi:hypothetical protein
MRRGDRTDNVIRLQREPGGVARGLRTRVCNGRYEVVTAGPNSEFGFIGSDPYQTSAYTGLVVPSTPTSQLGSRYLMLIARASFQGGEQSSDNAGVRLVGIRTYAELIARIPGRTSPLATGSGPPTGSTVVFRREIESPLWHPPDGNISWHVMTINKVSRDTRNPLNTDGVMFQDSTSPALLFQTLAGPPTAPTTYTAPNGGRPWGTAVQGLGNIHELRYRSRTDRSEHVLDIPIVPPCDIALFASVRQNDPALNPSLGDTAVTQQFVALSDEDRFLVAYSAFAQYGTLYGSLVFEDNIGRDVP